MKTIMSIRFVFAAALAAAVALPSAAFAASASPVPAAVAIRGVVVPVDHMGPGLGSAKSGISLHISSSEAAQLNTMSFHISGPAEAATSLHMGPGPGSVKSPVAGQL